jgi:hypothetical protein
MRLRKYLNGPKLNRFARALHEYGLGLQWLGSRRSWLARAAQRRRLLPFAVACAIEPAAGRDRQRRPGRGQAGP